MIRRITAFLLAAVMMLSLFACQKNDSENKDNAGEPDPTPVLKTENFTVSVSMMTYFFNSSFRSFVTQNEDSLDALGLDPAKPLKDQVYENEYTWFDYFCFYLADTIPQQIAMAEMAKKNGYELTEADEKYIEGELEKLNNAAKESGNAIAYFIRTNFGECVNEATVRKCLELARYSRHYSEELVASYKFSDEEADKYFDEHAKELLSFNYIRYQIDDCDVKTVTDDFASCVTEEDFVARIKEYAEDAVYDADEEYMAEVMESCYVYGAAYNDSSEFAKWAFADERQAYDIYISTVDDETVLVAMSLPGSEELYKDSPVLWKDVTPVHNIKSMVFSAEEYGNEKNAKTAAENVLKRINEGESFDKLMESYESGSTSNMVRGTAPDEIDEWVFDDARKEGEIGIITVKNGVTYLVQMKADGIAAWKHFTLDLMRNEAFANDIAKLLKSTDIEENNDALGGITPVTIG